MVDVYLQRMSRVPFDPAESAAFVTPKQGYNNLMQGSFETQRAPNLYLGYPRMQTTMNQNYIGRKMFLPGTQTSADAYSPRLSNIGLRLEQIPLRNIAGFCAPSFSKY